MSYYSENGLIRARRRRHRRATVVLLVVIALVLGGGGYAFAYWQGWVPGSLPMAAAKCTPTYTPTTPPQGRFTLNVYNASGTSGKANDVAQAMKSRSFATGSVGNDPYKKQLTGVGEIRFGSSGAAAARAYVAPLVPGATLVEDGRTDTSVDIAIGAQFPTLPAASASPTHPTGC